MQFCDCGKQAIIAEGLCLHCLWIASGHPDWVDIAENGADITSDGKTTKRKDETWKKK